MTKYIYNVECPETGKTFTRKSTNGNYIYAVIYYNLSGPFQVTYHTRRDLADKAANYLRLTTTSKILEVEAVPQDKLVKNPMPKLTLPAAHDFGGVSFTPDLASPSGATIFRIAGTYRGKLLWVESTGKYFRGQWNSIKDGSTVLDDGTYHSVDWSGPHGTAKRSKDLDKVILELMTQVDFQLEH